MKTTFIVTIEHENQAKVQLVGEHIVQAIQSYNWMQHETNVIVEASQQIPLDPQL